MEKLLVGKKSQALYDTARPRWESDLTRSDFDTVKQRLEFANV